MRTMKREDAFFQIRDDYEHAKAFILVIYDISDNKRRNRFSKLLQGYGVRVQRSGFEAVLSRNKYEKLLSEIPLYCHEEDSIRVYRIIGSGHIHSWGIAAGAKEDTLIII